MEVLLSLLFSQSKTQQQSQIEIFFCKKETDNLKTKKRCILTWSDPAKNIVNVDVVPSAPCSDLTAWTCSSWLHVFCNPQLVLWLTYMRVLDNKRSSFSESTTLCRPKCAFHYYYAHCRTFMQWLWHLKCI